MDRTTCCSKYDCLRALKTFQKLRHRVSLHGGEFHSIYQRRILLHGLKLGANDLQVHQRRPQLNLQGVVPMDKYKAKQVLQKSRMLSDAHMFRCC